MRRALELWAERKCRNQRTSPMDAWARRRHAASVYPSYLPRTRLGRLHGSLMYRKWPTQRRRGVGPVLAMLGLTSVIVFVALHIDVRADRAIAALVANDIPLPARSIYDWVRQSFAYFWLGAGLLLAVGIVGLDNWMERGERRELKILRKTAPSHHPGVADWF